MYHLTLSRAIGDRHTPYTHSRYIHSPYTLIHTPHTYCIHPHLHKHILYTLTHSYISSILACACMCARVCIVCTSVCSVSTKEGTCGSHNRISGVFLHHSAFLPWDRVFHQDGSLLFRLGWLLGYHLVSSCLYHIPSIRFWDCISSRHVWLFMWVLGI